MPSAARSWASARVKPTIPALAVTTWARLAAGCLDLTNDRVRFRAIAARIYHDGRAAFSQRQRDSAADIAAGAGDDGDFAREFLCHCYPRSDERSMRPLYNVPISFNAAS